MRITILICPFLLLSCIQHVCSTDQMSTGLKGKWKVLDDGMQEKMREERQYMSNTQMKNKFKKQYNRIHALTKRLSTIEAFGSSEGLKVEGLINQMTAITDKIKTLTANQASIETSLEVKCKRLDQLLHGTETPVDCCKTGFNVLCFSRYIANIYGFGGVGGDCPACPDFVS